MKKKLVVLILGGVLCIMAVGGCQGENAGADTTPTPTVTETPTPTPTETPLKTIGTESDSDSSFSVRLMNNTGLDITGFAVKKTEDAEYPENMLAQNDIFAADEERNLYYDSGVVPGSESVQDTTSVAETEGEAGEKALTQGYDIMLTFSDGSTLELNSFPFEDIEEGELCVEDGVAFVKYTSVSTQQEVSTKEAQLAVKSQKEAEAAAAAEEAQRQAEAAAAAEAQRQAEAEAAEEAQRQAEAEAAAEAQRQAEAAAAAEAQRQAEAEAAAEAQRQAEAEAAEEAQRQQEQQQNSDTTENDACLGDGLTW